jgi:site-specific recombinase XerD
MDLINEYLAWKGSYATAAARNYRLWLVRFYEFSGDPLEVTSDQYVRFKMTLDQKYSSKTVQLAIIAIRDFYKYLHEKEIKCLKYTLIKVPKAAARSYVPITEEEYKKMLRWCCVSTYKELQKTLIIRLLWDTGVRVSELCSLNLNSLNLPHANGTVATKKNNQQRMIFWSKETHELLLRYLGIRLCQNQQPALFQGLYKGDASTLRMGTRTAQRVVAEFVQKTGIGRRSAHSFRHGRAHQIIERGGTVADVQQILGHIAPSSSFIYLQMQDKELEKRARMFL